MFKESLLCSHVSQICDNFIDDAVIFYDFKNTLRQEYEYKEKQFVGFLGYFKTICSSDYPSSF